jgi:tetratricopeptide (TPR) repeat protein
MEHETAQPSASDPGESVRKRTGSQGKEPARRRRRWVAVVGAAIAAGLVAVIAWRALCPQALAEAEAAYRANQLEAALGKAQGHLAHWPFSRAAALVAARCLSRLDRPDEAEPYYRKAGRLDLQDRHLRAYALVRGNRREPAIQAYQEILADRPDDVMSLRRLAAVQISQSRWKEALAAAERLTRIRSGAVIGHTLAGVVYHDTRDPEHAVVEFDRVLELDPHIKQMPLRPRSMFWAEYGQNLLAVGRVDDAKRHLHRGLREGADAKLADLLGQCYYLKGEVDEAEQFWRLAVRWDRNRADTWWRIGRLELHKGRPEQAIAPLRRAAELEPKSVGPVYSLVLAYRRLGRRDEADRLQKLADRLRGKPDGTPQVSPEPPLDPGA